jgi:uncharacterized membrane protein
MELTPVKTLSQTDALISTPTGSAVAAAVAIGAAAAYPRLLDYAGVEQQRMYIPVSVTAASAAVSVPAVGELAAGALGGLSIVGLAFADRRKVLSGSLAAVPVVLSQEPLGLLVSAAIFIVPLVLALGALWKIKREAAMPGSALLAHLLDVVTTAVALDSGASESGLVASHLIDRVGVAGFGATKLALTGAALAVIYRTEDGEERDLLVFAIALLGLVAGARNLTVLP